MYIVKEGPALLIGHLWEEGAQLMALFLKRFTSYFSHCGIGISPCYFTNVEKKGLWPTGPFGIFEENWSESDTMFNECKSWGLIVKKKSWTWSTLSLSNNDWALHLSNLPFSQVLPKNTHFFKSHSRCHITVSICFQLSRYLNTNLNIFRWTDKPYEKVNNKVIFHKMKHWL